MRKLYAPQRARWSVPLGLGCIDCRCGAAGRPLPRLVHRDVLGQCSAGFDGTTTNKVVANGQEFADGTFKLQLNRENPLHVGGDRQVSVDLLRSSAGQRGSDRQR